MIHPNSQFRYWRADQVAECLDGIPDSLYQRLWHITQPEPVTPGLDYGETPPDSWDHCLAAQGWSLLTEDQQRLLNQLMEQYHAALGWTQAQQDRDILDQIDHFNWVGSRHHY